MAIKFNCPHCLTPYNLPDSLAGKKATCKTQSCRKALVVPQPGVAVGPTIAELGGIAPDAVEKRDDTPLPEHQEDIEAAALAALSEAPKEEKAADGQVIAVTCDYCGHQWTEPFAKAGKNVLCPDPECRKTVKVPVPKEKKADDWRDAANRPSLAKENFEKPADVVDAQAKVVSKEAWEKGGGAEQYLEPIPLKRKIFFGLLIGTPIIALIVGAVYWWQSRKVGQQDELMAQGVAEFNTYVDAGSELTPPETELYSAILHTAAGEYILRQKTLKPEELKEALDHLTKARESLRIAATKDNPKRPSASERNVLACELALVTLELGGSAEQVQGESRYPWVPDTGAARDARLHQRTYSAHRELQRTLELLNTADFDLKSSLMRRLARTLARHGPEALSLVEHIPVVLPDAERPEALAVLALEVYRHDPNSTLVRDIATDLKERLKGPGGRNPTPASAVTLWEILGINKVPTIASEPPKAPNPVSEPARLAYVGLHLLRNQPAEALELARRPSNSRQSQNVEQLRALTLYAEWATDPAAAFDHAGQIIGRHQKGDFPPPPSVVYRLVQLAAAAGKTEEAKKLADSLSDEGLKEMAKAEIVRQSSKSATDPSTVTAPDNPKELRAGHAWAHFWLARNNSRLSGDRSKEISAIATWQKGTIQPFGLAGIALGLRER